MEFFFGGSLPAELRKSSLGELNSIPRRLTEIPGSCRTIRRGAGVSQTLDEESKQVALTAAQRVSSIRIVVGTLRRSSDIRSFASLGELRRRCSTLIVRCIPIIAMNSGPSTISQLQQDPTQPGVRSGHDSRLAAKCRPDRGPGPWPDRCSSAKRGRAGNSHGIR